MTNIRDTEISRTRYAAIWFFLGPVLLVQLVYVLFHVVRYEDSWWFSQGSPTLARRALCATSALMMFVCFALAVFVSSGRTLDRRVVVALCGHSERLETSTRRASRKRRSASFCVSDNASRYAAAASSNRPRRRNKSAREAGKRW